MSSIMMMNKNKIRICGRNTMTLPTPAMTPSTTRLSSMPSGSTLATSAPRPVDARVDEVDERRCPREHRLEHDEHHDEQQRAVAGQGRLIQSMSRAVCVTTPEPGDSTRERAWRAPTRSACALRPPAAAPRRTPRCARAVTSPASLRLPRRGAVDQQSLRLDAMQVSRPAPANARRARPPRDAARARAPARARRRHGENLHERRG